MRLTFYNRTKLSAIFCIATANFIHICGLLNAQPVLTFNTAPASIRDVAFSYDGKYFATAGQQVKLWSATEKKLLRNLTGFITRIQSVTFSPKDNLIAGSGEKQGVIIWNTITGKQIRVLPNVPTNDVCFSSDGKYLACAGQGGIEIISTSDFSDFRTFGNTKTFLKVDFSPDSKMVIAADNSGRISKYNIQTGLLAFKITAHSKSISDLRFSVSGNFILSTAWDSKIKVWNSDNGEILSILDSKFGTNNASFYSNDSQIISGGYDGILTFTDWRNGMKLKTITGTLNDINRISVNPITNDLITSGESAKLDYWSFPADKPEWSIKPAEGAASSTNFRALAVHPKNVMIATAGYSGVIKILNPNAQDYVTEINTQSQNIQNLRFNNQGDLLISAGYKIKLWDVATYKSKGELRGYNDYIINDIELASNDSILYSIGNKPAIRIWNLHSKRQIGKIKTKRNCTSIALSSGGDKIIGGYKNGEYQVWDLKTHKLIYTAKISDSRIADISASSDDSILAFSTFNGKIIICSLKSGKTIRTLNAGSSMMAGYKYSDYLSQNVRLSPDNQYAISARPNGSVERLHWQTGQCDTLGVHTGFACNSEFTANNKFIVSIGEDAVIKIWNAQSLKELVFVTFSNNSENYYVVTTPQGHFFGTPKAMEHGYYVVDTTILPLSTYFEQNFTPGLLTMALNDGGVKSSVIAPGSTGKLPEIKFIKTAAQLPNRGTRIERFEPLITEKSTAVITVKSSGNGEPLKEIRIYVNRKLVANHLFESGIVTDTSVQFSISLATGINEIMATCFNQRGLETAKPDKIEIQYNAPQKSSHLHAIILGIDQYKNPKYNLTYAIQDAQSVKDILEEKGLDIYDQTATYYLQNSDVTRNNIEHLIDSLREIVTENDVFLFYFAGHGLMSIEDKPSFYLAPYDLTTLYGDIELLKERGISAEHLKEFSKKIKAQKQIFILDACQSGGITQNLASRGMEEEKAIARLAHSTGTYWLAASNSEQSAIETNELGHGIFTYCLLLGLNGEADSGTPDKIVTIKELSAFVDQKVPEYAEKLEGEKQYPTSFGFGNDFPIVLIKK